MVALTVETGIQCDNHDGIPVYNATRFDILFLDKFDETKNLCPICVRKISADGRYSLIPVTPQLLSIHHPQDVGKRNINSGNWTAD